MTTPETPSTEKAKATSEAGNVPQKKGDKPPRAQGDRAARYGEKKNTREMHPDVVPGMYKTRG